MASIKCGNCKGTHGSVADVRACYASAGNDKAEYAKREAAQERAAYQAKMERDDALMPVQRRNPETLADRMGATAFVPASEKQVKYIADLRSQRNIPATSTDGWSKQQASEEISRLLKLPKVDKKTGRDEEPEDGMYYVPEAEGPGHVYKVYKMVHGSGRQGVKQLVIQDGSKKGSFRYIGLAINKLPKNAKRMSLVEAKAFGRLYGFCIKCGATLTDEDSIAAGIGPICAGKGW
jgi:Family of unknown function (DUF6011)